MEGYDERCDYCSFSVSLGRYTNQHMLSFHWEKISNPPVNPPKLVDYASKYLTALRVKHMREQDMKKDDVTWQDKCSITPHERIRAWTSLVR